MYQTFITVIYTFLYLLFTFAFDDEIKQLSEETGFYKRTSRTQKFRMFFIGIAMFVVSTIIVKSSSDIWIQQLNWMQNAIETNRHSECSQQTDFTNIGFSASFYLSQYLFFQIGAVFGTSYSMPNIDLYSWINTHFVKRLIRTAIGVGCTYGIFKIFS